jgi:predicted kinase
MNDPLWIRGYRLAFALLALLAVIRKYYVDRDTVANWLSKFTIESNAVAAGWGEGIYSADWTAATYDRLNALGRRALGREHAVILVATFLSGDERQRAADTARAAGVPFVLVETVCDAAEVGRRLAARQARSGSASDASMEIYRAQRAAMIASPPAIPAGTLAITIDTGAKGPVSLDPALTALADARLITPAIPSDSPLFPAKG